MAGYDYGSDSSGENLDDFDNPFQLSSGLADDEDINLTDLKDACKLAWETAQNRDAFADGVEKTVGRDLSCQPLAPVIVTRGIYLL